VKRPACEGTHWIEELEKKTAPWIGLNPPWVTVSEGAERTDTIVPLVHEEEQLHCWLTAQVDGHCSVTELWLCTRMKVVGKATPRRTRSKSSDGFMFFLFFLI